MSELQRCRCGRLFKTSSVGLKSTPADGSSDEPTCPRCVHADQKVKEALSRLKESDFRFSVEVNKIPWDVYYVASLAGRSATVAIRLEIVDGHNRAVVGAVGEGDWDEAMMIEFLKQADN